MFNPYREWLGIPENQLPPNHYQLLGLTLFESDRNAISNAADRVMMYVRTFQTGKRSTESQKILNELAAARVCLLNPKSKAEYDAKLKSKLPVGGVVSAAPVTPAPIPMGKPAALPTGTVAPVQPQMPVGKPVLLVEEELEENEEEEAEPLISPRKSVSRKRSKAKQSGNVLVLGFIALILVIFLIIFLKSM